MTRPLHGRRARRAQWLADAAEIYRAHLLCFYGADTSPEDLAGILRARSEAKRAAVGGEAGAPMTRPICTDPITDEEIAAIARERIEEGADLALVRGTALRVNRRPNGDAHVTVCVVIPAALIAATRAAHLEYDDDAPTGETVVVDELDEATLAAAVEQARAAVAARTGGAA